MIKKHKLYLKLNLMSLFFIAVSFISVTLAWFAYSGLVSVETEIGVKAWYIEFQKGTEVVSNDIVISLSDIYPGMETVNELVSVKNLGDSDAQLNYSIVSARILDTEYVVDDNTITSEYLEDSLSHDYPFHVNINLSKHYVKAGDTTDSLFDVSVSWPLDSDTDQIDSSWGTRAYNFQKEEEKALALDKTYQIRTSIKIVISVKAEQYIETPTSSDPNFNLGDLVIYDVVNNHSCNSLSDSETCIMTHVINENSVLTDTTVDLLPDLYDTYLNSTFDGYNASVDSLKATWKVPTRDLKVNDLLNIVSTDVLDSLLVRDNLSDSIIGKLDYGTRLNTELQKLISYNGYYKFNGTKFSYLSSNKCYWINNEYNTSKGFAITKINDLETKIYGEDKTRECSTIPIIVASKNNIN